VQTFQHLNCALGLTCSHGAHTAVSAQASRPANHTAHWVRSGARMACRIERNLGVRLTPAPEVWDQRSQVTSARTLGAAAFE
jgi:hypothetical protein